MKRKNMLILFCQLIDLVTLCIYRFRCFGIIRNVLTIGHTRWNIFSPIRKMASVLEYFCPDSRNFFVTKMFGNFGRAVLTHDDFSMIAAKHTEKPLANVWRFFDDRCRSSLYIFYLNVIQRQASIGKALPYFLEWKNGKPESIFMYCVVRSVPFSTRITLRKTSNFFKTFFQIFEVHV